MSGASGDAGQDGAPRLTHFDPAGAARMVDVSVKAETARRAVAEGRIIMSSEAFALANSGTAKKGDVIGTARLAGIMAAKRTADLIPLCHPLPLSGVTVEIAPEATLPGFVIRASVTTTGRTGVEMEALTAVSVTALTIYDMMKSADRAMRIEGIRLVLKHGGKSGCYEAIP